MSLTPVNYRKTEFTHRTGLAADRPDPEDVLVGTLYFSTDTSALERSDGLTWSTYAAAGGGGGVTGFGPIFPITAPVFADFTAVNQGPATFSGSSDLVYMSEVGAGGFNIRVLKRIVPGATYIITAGLLISMDPGSFGSSEPMMGMVSRQSSDGKMVLNGLIGDNSIHYTCRYVNSPTSFNSTVFNGPTIWYGASAFWMRVEDNGTNRIFSTSYDKVNWVVIRTETRTTFITADEVGMFLRSSASSTSTIALSCFSWEQV